MVRKIITQIKYPVLIAGIIFCLVGAALRLGSGQAYAAASNIDPTDKWAWNKNVGWINFDPDGDQGVIVYADHLEGYAWTENVGWIRLGSDGGGSAPYYANTTKDNYGVNNDGSGNLSGYAWSKNVGWVNFDPAGDERVTINPATGSFDGYAWAENVGWIHFKGAGVQAYNVVTAWRVTVGGYTEPLSLLASSWLWVLLTAMVVAGAIAALAFKRRAA